VRWIDKVLEIALERMPTPLPDDVPLVMPEAEVVIEQSQHTGTVKH
jgi:ATP-dependent Lon protease